jgi:hypothetical protein
MPVDAETGAVDTAAVSADGATYTNAKYSAYGGCGFERAHASHNPSHPPLPLPTPPPPSYYNAVTIIVTGASGDHEGESKYVKASPSYTGSSNWGWGVYSALNATAATWEWHTVKADGTGPADFSDKLTWVRS